MRPAALGQKRRATLHAMLTGARRSAAVVLAAGGLALGSAACGSGGHHAATSGTSSNSSASAATTTGSTSSTVSTSATSTSARRRPGSHSSTTAAAGGAATGGAGLTPPSSPAAAEPLALHVALAITTFRDFVYEPLRVAQALHGAVLRHVLLRAAAATTFAIQSVRTAASEAAGSGRTATLTPQLRQTALGLQALRTGFERGRFSARAVGRLEAELSRLEITLRARGYSVRPLPGLTG